VSVSTRTQVKYGLILQRFADSQFARLRSPQQFALIQLVSSLSVITLQPIQVTRIWYKTLQIVIGYGKSYEEHLDAQAITFYVRGVAQNVTILGFLGEFRMIQTTIADGQLSQGGCVEPYRLAIHSAFRHKLSYVHFQVVRCAHPLIFANLTLQESTHSSRSTTPRIRILSS
jgi:hypothetical protein